MAMKIQGFSKDEISKELGLSKETLRYYLYLAGKNGWLQFTSAQDHLEYGLVPKIVENIEHHLNARDKKVTIEAAKGVGLFRSHSVIKSEQAPAATVLALKIEMPSSSPVQLPTGVVLGEPRAITASSNVVEGVVDADQ
jgi:hypothetical protein